MNLLLFEPDEVGPDGRARLVDRRAEHLRRVLRVTPGKTLRAAVIDGAVGTATVLEVDGEGVELAVAVGGEGPPPSGIVLVVALPRPQALHRLLQTAAAMAVDRLELVRTWRVEKSYFDSPSLLPEAIRRQLVLGAEQGMTPRLPPVGVHHRLGPFLDGLAEPPAGEARLVAHPEAPPLEAVFSAAVLPATATGIVLAVGPEGGLLDREIEAFGRRGFVPFRLGPWVLRVESAVVAALAQLELLGRRRPTSC